MDLPPRVIAWRVGHAAIAVGFLGAIFNVWRCAITRERGPLLTASVAALAAEGALVAANRGDCPIGPVGDRIGDQVPLFELVLPPRAAKLAVPALGLVAAAGIGLLAARRPTMET